MTAKLIGAAAVVISAWVAGSAVAQGEKEKALAVGALYRFANAMKRRIFIERAPLDVIFACYSDPFLEKRGFLAELRRVGPPDALWANAAEKLPLEGKTKSEILAFGENLGKISLPEQEKAVEALIGFLGEERAEAEKTLDGRLKSIRAIALLCGLLAVLILV